MGGEEGLGVTTGQPNLYKQDLSKLDVSKLTALSREVISRQATINIGTIGHVAHGKSTIVKAISGVQTVRFKNELERNITIKLDARAVEDTRGDQEDTVDNVSEMSTTRLKRPSSPGIVQPIAKQPKLEQKIVSSYEDSNGDDDSATSISDDNVFFSQTVEKQIKNASKSKENSFHSTSRETSVESTRLSTLNDIDNNKSSTKVHSDNELCFKYNLGDVKLKQLRVILKDIKHNVRSGRRKVTIKRKLWEVERILGSNEQNGVVTYLIKWKDWGPEYNTWEPVSNLINCQNLLDNFEKERLKMLKRFQNKTNFYPNSQDIETFLKQMKRRGKSLSNISIERNQLYANIRNYFKTAASKRFKIENSIKNKIVCLAICDLRKKQLESLQEWEGEMNSITKGKPVIRVENVVDLESAPQDFYYIDEYLPGASVIIPDDPPIGCECETCNPKTNCCFTQYDGYCPYTTTCKIRVPPGTPIYECNKRCTCDMNCVNRVVQRGAQMNLCIFRTSNGRGWGVKTLRSIKKGTFVTQYVGEVITNEEAEKRGKEYDAAGRTYLFDLDYNETEGQCPYTVDAAVYGNVSHFINHSCDPNLAVYGVWINCLDPNLPKLALFATRDIKQNEEITFDYMCQSSKNSENSIKRDVPPKKTLDTDITATSEEEFDRPETPESNSSNNKTLCKCCAPTCRRYLF